MRFLTRRLDVIKVVKPQLRIGHAHKIVRAFRSEIHGKLRSGKSLFILAHGGGDVPEVELRLVVVRVSSRPQLKRTARGLQISGHYNLIERSNGKLFAFARPLSQFVSLASSFGGSREFTLGLIGTA